MPTPDDGHGHDNQCNAPRVLGYRRQDGRVGTRNHVLVVPTVICSAVVAERVAASAAPVAAALPHLAGCGQLGPDMRVTHDTLAAYCAHPNVGAVLVIALGVRAGGGADAGGDREAARQAGRDHRDPVRGRHGQDDRERAPASSRRWPSALASAEREWCDVDSWSCRSSAADPTTPRAWHRTRRSAASPIASSISAAAPCSARSPRSWAPSTCWPRARRTQGRHAADSGHHAVESEARALGLDIRGTQPSPGNIRGGLTTIEEKSLGATHKGGERAPLEEVVGYAAPIRRKG